MTQGTEDDVVNWLHGNGLWKRAREPYEPLWIKGGGHCNLELYPDYIRHLCRFVQEMENTTTEKRLKKIKEKTRLRSKTGPRSRPPTDTPSTSWCCSCSSCFNCCTCSCRVKLQCPECPDCSSLCCSCTKCCCCPRLPKCKCNCNCCCFASFKCSKLSCPSLYSCWSSLYKCLCPFSCCCCCPSCSSKKKQNGG